MAPELLATFTSTLPADDHHPYRTGPWRPQRNEWRALDLEVVEGKVPDDLDGVYLRQTENPLHPPIKHYHPFDGDGMLHCIEFRDGKANYHNKFVRTDGFLAEQQAGRSLWAGFIDEPLRRRAHRRLGRARPDEGRLEHRRHRAPRGGADQLLPVRRPVPGGPLHRRDAGQGDLRRPDSGLGGVRASQGRPGDR
ncbi:retinal pigment epithelial membrane family protein [Mycolicibacterium hassiacum DSM 44199]|uniref:Dioxygenase n=1 Tax=Mycolicibacterium hassiacum (strain DSM 44199 / CIP 105218 / JCM 12690 / 3849) TaxID=1122247 RepID=K5BA77_MYCHD|nr:retinal pigment epithelial membrane family protein [Mycolicibacterium hassiacum DSM 44199]